MQYGKLSKPKDGKEAELRLEEENLIMLCRETKYGEITVKLKDGRPVMASTVKKDVKLD